MKFLLFCVMVLAFNSVWAAGIHGDWTGWGQWSFEGSGTRCVMNLQFRDSERTLKRLGGKFDCDFVAMEIPEMEWVKDGEALAIDGQKVGTLTEHAVSYTEKYSDTVTVETSIQIDGRHVDYQEIWYEKNNEVLYEIKGRLFLKDGF